jgi:hypothetical protein
MGEQSAAAWGRTNTTAALLRLKRSDRAVRRAAAAACGGGAAAPCSWQHGAHSRHKLSALPCARGTLR